MRGEDATESQVRDTLTGSPPHARGRRARSACFGRLWGITPACAGKTKKFLKNGRQFMDHPRMRGEDSARTFSFMTVRWITPACAGKTD